MLAAAPGAPSPPASRTCPGSFRPCRRAPTPLRKATCHTAALLYGRGNAQAPRSGVRAVGSSDQQLVFMYIDGRVINSMQVCRYGMNVSACRVQWTSCSASHLPCRDAAQNCFGPERQRRLHAHVAAGGAGSAPHSAGVANVGAALLAGEPAARAVAVCILRRPLLQQQHPPGGLRHAADQGPDGQLQ